jgi:hypothetical protein
MTNEPAETPGASGGPEHGPGHDTDPNDLDALDPDQFVGEAPAGDSQPGEFMSTDQSAPAAAPEGDGSEPEEDR